MLFLFFLIQGLQDANECNETGVRGCAIDAGNGFINGTGFDVLGIQNDISDTSITVNSTFTAKDCKIQTQHKQFLKHETKQQGLLLWLHNMEKQTPEESNIIHWTMSLEFGLPLILILPKPI